MTEDDKTLVSRAVFAAATDGCIEQQDLVGLIHLIESLSAEVAEAEAREVNATAAARREQARVAELSAEVEELKRELAVTRDGVGPLVQLGSATTDQKIASEARVRALEEALRSIQVYGSDTLSGRADGGADDRAWHRSAVVEMTNRATRVLGDAAVGAANG